MGPTRIARILSVMAGLCVAVGLYLGLVVAPPDATQGEVQRIMYLHVPSILTAYVAFTATFLAIFFIPLFYVLVVQVFGGKKSAVAAAPGLAVPAEEGH